MKSGGSCVTNENNNKKNECIAKKSAKIMIEAW